MIMERFSLRGKTAFVTGGAGLYGRQIVRALHEAGATVYTTSRNRERLRVVEESFREENVAVRALEMDLGDERSVLTAIEQAAEESGSLDILVNNAVERTMNGWKDPVVHFARSMEVNATGLFAVTRAAADRMAKQGGGSIVNIGSIQGMVGVDLTLYEGLDWSSSLPDYFFHKGGMINFTRFVASYYGMRSVRCNCVSPGGLRSGDPDERFVRRYEERTMLGRMANDTDLMGIIVFLASDASSYITAANIPVDGGYTAK